MKEVVIIGAGGHASVIIDILKSMMENDHELSIKGLLDDRENLEEFMGYKVLGKVEDAKSYSDENILFIIAIGNNSIRNKIAAQIIDKKFITAIHSTAIIGSNVVIEEGTVVMPRAVINANSTIGKHAIINSGAIVEHDNKIEDFVHISPGATLCGGVSIGESTHIGANSTVIPCINIGCESVIGAGSSVINDIESKVMAAGIPAINKKNL